MDKETIQGGLDQKKPGADAMIDLGTGTDCGIIDQASFLEARRAKAVARLENAKLGGLAAIDRVLAALECMPPDAAVSCERDELLAAYLSMRRKLEALDPKQLPDEIAWFAIHASSWWTFET